MDETPETPDAFTTVYVEQKYLIPRSTQKKARAKGLFAPHYSVGRRVYYLRSSFEAWISAQERTGGSAAGESGDQAQHDDKAVS